MTKGVKEKDIMDFERYCNKLKAVMDRIVNYAPEANLYAAIGDINLMFDCKRDGFGGSPSQDSIVTGFSMKCTDGTIAFFLKSISQIMKIKMRGINGL